jgi:hypothetical protein
MQKKATNASAHEQGRTRYSMSQVMTQHRMAIDKYQLRFGPAHAGCGSRGFVGSFFVRFFCIRGGGVYSVYLIVARGHSRYLLKCCCWC